MVDIPRIKFFGQRRYRANWPFVDGYYLVERRGGVNAAFWKRNPSPFAGRGIHKPQRSILAVLTPKHLAPGFSQEGFFEQPALVVAQEDLIHRGPAVFFNNRQN